MFRDKRIEEIHLQYLTDRTLQTINNEIVTLYQIVVPKWKFANGIFEPLYPPDHAYEIKRLIEIRNDYIIKNYPELMIWKD